MLAYVDVFRGAEKLYELSVVEQDGKLHMAPDYTPGGTLLFPHMFTRMAWILRELCGAGQVMTPSAEDFNNAELAPHLHRYFRGKPGVDALHKTKLMKLAWELTSDQFGSRATLYEYFHSGDPVHNMARRHTSETSPLFREMLASALADMDESLVAGAALT
jgi:aromatic ring hydroxylase